MVILLMITVRCGNCDARFSAEDRHAGKKAKCPKCGASLYVPVMPSSKHTVTSNTARLPSSSDESVEQQPDLLPISAVHSSNRSWPWIRYLVQGSFRLTPAAELPAPPPSPPWIRHLVRSLFLFLWVLVFFIAIVHQARWPEVAEYIEVLLVGVAVCYEPYWGNVGRFNLVKWPLLLIAFVLHMTQFDVEANAGVIVGNAIGSLAYLGTAWFFLWAFLKSPFRKHR